MLQWSRPLSHEGNVDTVRSSHGSEGDKPADDGRETLRRHIQSIDVESQISAAESEFQFYVVCVSRGYLPKLETWVPGRWLRHQ